MWLWNWLATRAASFWIAAIASALIGASYIYITDLKIDAARCKGQQDVKKQIEKLTDRVVRDVEDEADEAIREIRRTDDECANTRMPDSILDGLRDD